VAADLARYLGDLEAEPGRLEQIAERRSALAGLTRKYGATVDEVLAWGAEAAAVRLG
jgi:DNA repair protein RecN (Recombination protein N)